MYILNHIKFKTRKSLNNILSGIRINVSRSNFDEKRRKEMLEELFFYNPDNITKEIINNYYFNFELLIDFIDDRIQMILKDYLISMLTKRKCTFISKNGKLTRKGKKIIVSEFNFLPPPFLKRLHSRLGLIQIDKNGLQEDYIRLTRIIDIMKEKGHIISNKSKKYYHNIDFNNLLDEYIIYKYSENYLQLVLERLKILPISYDKTTRKSDKIKPIAEEKEITQLKKNLINYINLCISDLNLTEKKDFVNAIVKNNFTFIEGKKIIFKLSILLNNKDYKEASNQLISAFEEIRDKEFQFGKIEIGPKGLYN